MTSVRLDEHHDAVVKRGIDRRQVSAEAETLRAFGEHRAVRVLEVRPDERTLTLERVRPGTSLASEATEDEAMEVVVGLLSRQWPAADAASSAQAFDDFAGALRIGVENTGDPGVSAPGHQQLRRARALLDQLQEARVPPVLLHGDLHYDNILKSDRAGWVLIDPKGVVGESAFDVGYLVSRPSPRGRDRLPLPVLVERRLAFLPAATGLAPDRVAAYAYVAATLSALWALEDRDGAVVEFAHMLEALEAHPLVRALG